MHYSSSKLNKKVGLFKFNRINSYYPFENDWREPLTIKEFILFNLLTAIPVHNHFHLISDIYHIMDLPFLTKLNQYLIRLKKKHYITLKSFIYHNNNYSTSKKLSYFEIYCYDEKGNVVNNDKALSIL